MKRKHKRKPKAGLSFMRPKGAKIIIDGPCEIHVTERKAYLRVVGARVDGVPEKRVR